MGWLETPVGRVPRVDTRLNWNDRAGHWQMRWGIGRNRYRIAPGLYAVGVPNDQSPVLVSANYKMSFDLLRRSLAGLDAWLLVIDTKGINVWCAAGKGTFGTREIVQRVGHCELDRLVSHRTLIVPQLGAPGVAVHRVKHDCGFSVVYGPVRAMDLKVFLAAGMKATEAMRRVGFSTLDRLVLTPVELTGMIKSILGAALLLFIVGGIGPGWFSLTAAWDRGTVALGCLLTGIMVGAVGVPVLLPWIPGRAFSIKGAMFGLLVSLLMLAGIETDSSLPENMALLLALPAVSSYCAMNFTGSTTFTSPSGVEKEMRRAIPAQLAALLMAGIFWIGAAF
ncbi:MAG: hypothetical protein A2X84_11040 [Desulfuromonadaceae bacterium GWC2_58_13]|nr:MAG: hypothetical protein A2X84_11040 [Desulfuromonadaceae bacterium GWC2_58_13]